MSGPMPLLAILITYLYFCAYAGPRWMKDRKPFDLKYVLIAYNALIVMASTWLFNEVRHFHLDQFRNLFSPKSMESSGSLSC
jgi:hypothetical protein